MVKRVYGTLDTTDILFSFNSDSGLWETTVPEHEEGVYIVEIYAEDEAGNVAYMATALFTFDSRGLCINIEVSQYNAAFKISQYDLNIVRCEVCGRW
jgi:hypothetical protein